MRYSMPYPRAINEGSVGALIYTINSMVRY